METTARNDLQIKLEQCRTLLINASHNGENVFVFTDIDNSFALNRSEALLLIDGILTNRGKILSLLKAEISENQLKDTIQFLESIRKGLHSDHFGCILGDEEKEKYRLKRIWLNFAIECVLAYQYERKIHV